MVGAVEQRRRSVIERTEVIDRPGQEVVRIADRVVVGIDQHLPVLGSDRHIIVGFEMGELPGIALVVAEVRAVAVEDQQDLLRPAPLEHLAHLVEQLHVVARRTDVDQMLRIVREVVDHGPLPRLVGDEPGLEPGLVEQGRKALAAVEFLMLVGIDRREDQRHALVRGVALREHITENHQIIDLREFGIGLPVIPVELPVHRPRRLADDVEVDFAPRSLGRAAGLEAEIARRPFEMVRLAELRAAQPEVIEDVHREDLVAEHMLLLADAVCRPEGQQADREDRRTGQSDIHARRARDVALVGDLTSRKPQQREVEHAHQNHRRVDVAEQLARLARIGRQDVGEHVGGDDRVAEQVEQHDLEGTEEDEREGEPDHHARAAQRHTPHHVEAQRHEDQRLDSPHRIGLRVGQHAVGDDQRRKEIDRQQRRETAAGLDRAASEFLVGISSHNPSFS